MDTGIRLAKFFFSLQTNIRMYHWRTPSYARHQATNALLPKIDANMDAFMEVYQGKFGKLPIDRAMISVEIEPLNDNTAAGFFARCIDFLDQFEALIGDGHTDLFNIRDTVKGDLNQTLYLFTFK
jgi:hypothetical protein